VQELLPLHDTVEPSAQSTEMKQELIWSGSSMPVRAPKSAKQATGALGLAAGAATSAESPASAGAGAGKSHTMRQQLG